MIDITDKQFGKLTVIQLDKQKTQKGKGVIWDCGCSCGKKISVRSDLLRYGKVKDCGCEKKREAKNKRMKLERQKFGRLRFLKPTNKRKYRYIVWQLKCDCGTIIEEIPSQVKRGMVNSCGCLRREIHSRMGKENKITVLLGKTYGRLKPFEELPNRDKWGSVLFNCRCICGNITIVTSYRLRKGLIRSCGCLKRDTSSLNGKLNSLVIYGKKYGMLTAILPIEERSSNGAVLWQCDCDCGGVKYTTVSRLKNGLVKSCGCLKKG